MDDQIPASIQTATRTMRTSTSQKLGILSRSTDVNKENVRAPGATEELEALDLMKRQQPMTTTTTMPKPDAVPKMTISTLREALKTSKAVSAANANNGPAAIAVAVAEPPTSKIKQSVAAMDQPTSALLESDLQKERKKRMDLESEAAERRRETLHVSAANAQLQKEVEQLKAKLASKTALIDKQEDGKAIKAKLLKLEELHRASKEKHSAELELERKAAQAASSELATARSQLADLTRDMEDAKLTIGRSTLRQQELEDQVLAANAKLNQRSLELSSVGGELKTARKELEEVKAQSERQRQSLAEEIESLKTSLDEARAEGATYSSELQEQNDDLRLLLQAATIEFAKLWATRRAEAQDARERARLASLETSQLRSDFEVVMADNVRLQKDLKEGRSALRELRRAELEEVWQAPCDCKQEVDFEGGNGDANAVESDLRDELAVADLKRRHHKLAQVYATEQLHLARLDVATLESALADMQNDYLELKQQLRCAKVSASSEEMQREDMRGQILALTREKERAIADEEEVRSEYAAMAEQLRMERDHQEISRTEIRRLLGEIRVKEAGLRNLEEQVQSLVAELEEARLFEFRYEELSEKYDALSRRAAAAQETAEKLDMMNASLSGLPSDESRIGYIQNLRVEIRSKSDDVANLQTKLKASRLETENLRRELRAYKAVEAPAPRTHVPRLRASQLHASHS